MRTTNNETEPSSVYTTFCPDFCAWASTNDKVGSAAMAVVAWVVDANLASVTQPLVRKWESDQLFILNNFNVPASHLFLQLLDKLHSSAEGARMYGRRGYA